LKRKQHSGSETKRKINFAPKRNEKLEAKPSAKQAKKLIVGFLLEHAKTMRNGSRFASFRFEANKFLSETGAP
jgi:hypothetical protein